MAVCKCKMCGGELRIEAGMSIAECEYCGLQQTIPNADNDKKINLFNRANNLRINSDFDQAASVYELIVSEFPNEAEAYWGNCLCSYGIEYVTDPVTNKKVPTCHRTVLTAIFEDQNFKLAMEKANLDSQYLYKLEAEEIDRIQKSILDIAKNEEPYDVFICYKETGSNGRRTKDSVLSQDIYDALTAAGYRVFFARITLEDKLGQEYEPYIFSALYSSRVMLAVGTDFEHFNSTWVKNEWSRYLRLMREDRKKKLIPCYADIDAYDLPQEFQNFQALNIGSIAYIQSLLENIGRIIPKKGGSEGNSKLVKLLEKGQMALDHNDFDAAKKHFNKALIEDDSSALAYWGMFQAQHGFGGKSASHNLSEALSKDPSIAEDDNLSLALSNADKDFSKKLKGIFKNAVNELTMRAYELFSQNGEGLFADEAVTDEAAKLFETAYMLDKDNDDALLGLFLTAHDLYDQDLLAISPEEDPQYLQDLVGLYQSASPALQERITFLLEESVNRQEKKRRGVMTAWYDLCSADIQRLFMRDEPAGILPLFGDYRDSIKLLQKYECGVLGTKAQIDDLKLQIKRIDSRLKEADNVGAMLNKDQELLKNYEQLIAQNSQYRSALERTSYGSEEYKRMSAESDRLAVEIRKAGRELDISAQTIHRLGFGVKQRAIETMQKRDALMAEKEELSTQMAQLNKELGKQNSSFSKITQAQ